MARQPGFFDADARLAALSADGDAGAVRAVVDFEMFRPDLEAGRIASSAVERRSTALRPGSDVPHPGAAGDATRCPTSAEYLLRDRLSFMRFVGLGLDDPVPDAKTIWPFREELTRAAREGLFARFDASLREPGYLAMGGQIVDATVVHAPRQRNTAAEKAAIKAGRIPDGWAEKPAKLCQKDQDARWTVKFSKAKPREDGAPQVDLAVPAFGYKSHVRSTAGMA